MNTEEPLRKLSMSFLTILGGVLSICFALYVTAPDIFERKLYFNEVLAACGILLFFLRPVVFRRSDFVYNYVIFFLGYGLLQAIFSTWNVLDWYGWFRQVVVVYSAFSFFTGAFLVNYFYKSGIPRKTLWFFANWIHPVAAIPLSALLASYFFAKKYILPVIVVLQFILFFYMGQLTQLVAAILVLILAVSRRVFFVTWVSLFLSFIFIGLVSYVYFYETFDGADIDEVYSYSDIANIDHNSTVRSLMWAKVVGDIIPSHPFGLGLGVPIFIDSEISQLQLGLVGTAESNPFIEYTLSTHNSFIYLLARFGVPFFLVVFSFHVYFVWYFLKNHFHRASAIHLSAFIAVILAVVAACFNVVLESPIHAGMYWGILGMYWRLTVKANEGNVGRSLNSSIVQV